MAGSLALLSRAPLRDLLRLMRVALCVVALACASCVTAPPVAPRPFILGPIRHTVPIFTTTWPAQCVDMGDLDISIPPDREPPGLWPDGETRAIVRLQRAAVAAGGDALVLLRTEEPEDQLYARVLDCGL